MKISYMFLIGAIVVAAAVLFPCDKAVAHDWKSDAWAMQQIVVTVDIIVCEKALARSYADFKSYCKFTETVSKLKALSKQLSTAMNEHPDDTTLRVFIDTDFKNKELAAMAFQSITQMHKTIDKLNKRMDRLLKSREPMINF